LHTGWYNEDTFLGLKKFNDAYNSYFSELVRSDFSDALSHFGKGSVDLLHIDGCHTAEAVRDDFDSWRSRLSDNAIVLMHDINVRERGFGVAQIWECLRKEYSHFEFWHGAGLGVLSMGGPLPMSLETLFNLADNNRAAQEIRLVYSRLGLAIADRIERDKYREACATISRLQEQLRCQSYLAAVASQRAAEVEQLRQQLHTRVSFLGWLRSYVGQSRFGPVLRKLRHGT
jgi:hypothetical protein